MWLYVRNSSDKGKLALCRAISDIIFVGAEQFLLERSSPSMPSLTDDQVEHSGHERVVKLSYYRKETQFFEEIHENRLCLDASLGGLRRYKRGSWLRIEVQCLLSFGDEKVATASRHWTSYCINNAK